MKLQLHFFRTHKIFLQWFASWTSRSHKPEPLTLQRTSLTLKIYNHRNGNKWNSLLQCNSKFVFQLISSCAIQSGSFPSKWWMRETSNKFSILTARAKTWANPLPRPKWNKSEICASKIQNISTDEPFWYKLYGLVPVHGISGYHLCIYNHRGRVHIHKFPHPSQNEAPEEVLLDEAIL